MKKLWNQTAQIRMGRQMTTSGTGKPQKPKKVAKELAKNRHEGTKYMKIPLDFTKQTDDW